MRILLTEDIDRVARRMFKKAGHEVKEIRRALRTEELAEEEWDVAGIRSGTRITEEVFRKPRLVVAAYCIGVNKIDQAACDRHGCVTFNDPFNNGPSVAELAITNIGVLFRQLLQKHSEISRGVWNKSAKKAREIRGKTLGVIGWGSIGRQVGALAEAIGMKVIFYDIAECPAPKNARKCSSMRELLRKSDVVSLHVDDRKQNLNFFGQTEIDAMKRGAMVMNYSRGFVVDEKALAEAIKTGRLGGAAIDVFQNEPGNGNTTFVSPFQGLDNVVLTPHTGGNTKEAQHAIGVSTTNLTLEYIAKGTIKRCLNFRGDSYTNTPIAGTHRVIYWHPNTHGQVGGAAQAIGELGGNIRADYLMTNNRVGCAFFDVEIANTQPLLAKLESLPGAIRVRIL